MCHTFQHLVEKKRNYIKVPSTLVPVKVILKYVLFLAFCSNIFGSSTTKDRSTKHPKFDPTGVQTHDL